MAEDHALDGWIPFRIDTRTAECSVQWCFAGEARFTEPFFEDTVRRLMRSPFNQLFALQTSTDTLTRRAMLHPGIAPSGFIFHVSRCGSTLFAQLAAALPRTIVISEAAPIDDVLRSGRDEELRLQWLRAVVSALGQPRLGDERHLFVKFDSWHVTDLALVQRAFPSVPCVFMYRDPSAVLASQSRMPGLQMIPGRMAPARIGLTEAEALRCPREEYVARVLGAVYAAALTYAVAGRVTLVNYDELPGRASSLLFDWCGIDASDEHRATLDAVASRDAKTPVMAFDPSKGRDAFAPELIEAAERFIGRAYQELESLRTSPSANVRQLTPRGAP